MNNFKQYFKYTVPLPEIVEVDIGYIKAFWFLRPQQKLDYTLKYWFEYGKLFDVERNYRINRDLLYPWLYNDRITYITIEEFTEKYFELLV